MQLHLGIIALAFATLGTHVDAFGQAPPPRDDNKNCAITLLAGESNPDLVKRYVVGYFFQSTMNYSASNVMEFGADGGTFTDYLDCTRVANGRLVKFILIDFSKKNNLLRTKKVESIVEKVDPSKEFPSELDYKPLQLSKSIFLKAPPRRKCRCGAVNARADEVLVAVQRRSDPVELASITRIGKAELRPSGAAEVKFRYIVPDQFDSKEFVLVFQGNYAGCPLGRAEFDLDEVWDGNSFTIRSEPHKFVLEKDF